MENNSFIDPNHVPDEYKVPYDIIELPSQGLLYKNKKSKDNNKPDILWPINDWNLIYHKSKLNGSKKMTSTFFNQITTEIILKSQDTKQKKIKTK